MTDIATLGLRVDSRQIAQGTQALDRLGDQATMTEAQTTRATRNMSRGFAVTGAAAKGMSQSFNANNTRMFAMQLSQVAQQAQAGGGVLRALSIQAADIGMAFGTIGIAAGVAAGAILPLAQRFFEMEQDARSLDDRIGDLSSAFRELQSAQDLASASASELIERYGVVDGQIRRIIEGLREVSLSQFRTQVEGAIAGFADLEGEVGTAIELLTRFESASGRNLRAVQSAFENLPPSVREAAREVQAFAVSANEDLQTQRDRAIEAAEALAGLNDPTYDTAEALLLRFADIASQQLGRVRAEAASTASALSALGGRGSGRSAGPGGVLVGATGNGFDWRAEGALDAADAFLNPPSSGGGGGGGSSGAREITAEMRAADQAIRQAQEAAVRFADVQGVLNQRLASGSIDLETYNAALDQAREKYAEVSDATEFWDQQQRALKDGILDAIVAGDNLADTFQNLAQAIARAALEAALFGEGPFAGANAGGGLLGGLFSSVFPRSAGGPVTAGQAYVVGEKRPELFVPGSSGRIIPSVGEKPVVNVQIENNAPGVQVQDGGSTTIDGVQTRRFIISTMRQAVAEGELDRSLGARFGSRPQRIRQ